MKFALPVAIILAAISCCLAAPAEHRVYRLPGLCHPIRYPVYAGMVNVTVDKRFFYVLVQASEVEASTAPVVLWLNGGPASSSMHGFFMEHGPWRPTVDGASLRNFDYAWNRVANILYVDQPGGVGFSWSKVAADLPMTDAKAARDMAIFLEHWYELYPEFMPNKLYLTGESYAGHYIPAIANEIVQRNIEGVTIPHVTGLLLGNPVTFLGWNLNGNRARDGMNDGWPYVSYLHQRGFIPPMIYYTAKAACGWDEGLSCQPHNYTKSSSQACVDAVEAAIKIPPLTTFMDIYDVTAPVCLKNAKPLPQFHPDPCLKEYTVAYLAKPEVEQALHTDWQIQKFAIANMTMRGGWDFDATHFNATLHYSSFFVARPQWKIEIFNGVLDACIAWLGTERWVRCLGRPIVANWHSWFVNETGQLGGMAIDYDLIHLRSVKSGGHMVPLTAPETAFQLWLDYLAL